LASLFEFNEKSPAYRRTGYAPHPTGQAGRAIAPLGGYALAIPANIAPERIASTWTALATLTSARSIKLYTMNGSLACPRRSVSGEPEVRALSPILSTIDEMASRGFLQMWPRPPAPDISDVITIAGEEVHDALSGRKSAAGAFSEFGGTIYRVADSPFGPWRTPRRDRVGNRRFYAAKSAPTAEGHRYYFGWTPDRADQSNQGEWYWGGIFAAPHEAVPAADGALDIRLPQAVVNAFREPISWEYLPFAGDSHADDKVIEVRSIGALACGFLRFSAPRFLFSCTVYAKDCRDHFGFVLKSDRELARCLLLSIEPATGRVSLVNFPYPVDPFWAASVASMVEAAEPGPDGPRVAEAFLDLRKGEAIDVKILVDHSLIEVFVDERVALNYRWYGAADYELGTLVQDGEATYSGIQLKG
jgi:hypothetical protein